MQTPQEAVELFLENPGNFSSGKNMGNEEKK